MLINSKILLHITSSNPEFSDSTSVNCKYQILSEDFIREFEDEVCWDWISKYQNLSEDFKLEMKLLGYI